MLHNNNNIFAKINFFIGLYRNNALNMTDGGLKFIGAVRIFGEPPFFYPFFLVEQLFDCPKRRESENSGEGREYDIVDTQRDGNSCQPKQQKNPPATRTPIVFGLDYNRVEYPNDEKCTNSYKEPLQVIVEYKIHKYKLVIKLFHIKELSAFVNVFFFCGVQK